ncbi:MAG TPA: presenilin family intramembrane aspartyl protease, partial [Methanomicrobiales archaeon]|nr:presenilin family intramembrane aspartyl protease [Methanomicrobiales archaeon]
MNIRTWIPILAMPGLLIAVELLALLLSLPLQAAGIVAFENPSSVINPLIFIGILLVFTAFLLLLIRWG